MIDTFKQAKLVLMVGHNTRRRLVFRRAKEILNKGMIGKVVALEGNLSRPAGLQPGLPPWKADPKACPLLPMTQLGIHLVDTAEYLVSPVQTVCCVAPRIAMPGNVYDTTAAILATKSGVPFALSSYYVSPDAYYLRIYGTNGLLHCYPTSLRLELTEGGEPKEARDEVFQEGAGSYNLQMQVFGDCILHQREPETGGREGLRALAVIEAMAGVGRLEQSGPYLRISCHEAVHESHSPSITTGGQLLGTVGICMLPQTLEECSGGPERLTVPPARGFFSMPAIFRGCVRRCAHPRFAPYWKSLTDADLEADQQFIATELKLNNHVKDMLQVRQILERTSFVYALTGDPRQGEMAKLAIDRILRYKRWDYFLEGGGEVGSGSSGRRKRRSPWHAPGTGSTPSCRATRRKWSIRSRKKEPPRATGLCTG